MKYKDEKEMLFAFLKRFDYSQPLETVLHDVGYDLGDFCFMEYKSEKIISLVKHIWVELHLNNS